MKNILAFSVILAAVSAQAGFPIKDFVAKDGAILEHGYIYRVNEDASLKGAPHKPALDIPEEARVGIYIPKGITLTLVGGDGNMREPGAPGIHVPESATVYIMGEGTLNATGGGAGSGSDGKSGGRGIVLKDADEGRAGNGGKGGAGGGGAAPGVGGYGGKGAQETEETPGPVARCNASEYRTQGTEGHTGNTGGDGENSGRICILGAVTVNVVGGNCINATPGGIGVLGENSTRGTSAGFGWSNDYSAGGGGSGGGGGTGKAANAIGGGAGGGGSGGAGGSGGLDVITGILANGTYFNPYGGNGAGGYGGKAGEAGIPNPGMGFITWGGYYGKEGASGKTGTSDMFKYPTAAVPNVWDGNFKVTDGEWEDIGLPLHFDNNGGATSDDAAVYCGGPVQKKVECPNRAPELPSGKDIFVFDGYFDENDEQFYDGNGARVSTSQWLPLADRTLKAKWHVEYAPCRLTLFDEVSIEVPYMAEELPTLEKEQIPTRVGYQFAGFEDQNGVPFYDAKGEMVEAEREIIDDMKLVAKWSPNKYTATLACGFEGEGAFSTGSTTVAYEQIPGKLRVPLREGYTFIGYFDDEGNMYFNQEGKGVAPYTILGGIALTARWAPMPETIDPIAVRQRWPWNGEYEVTYAAKYLRPERHYSLIVEFSVVEEGSTEAVTRKVTFPIESKNGEVTVVANMTPVIAKETLDEAAAMRLRLVLNKVEAE